MPGSSVRRGSVAAASVAAAMVLGCSVAPGSPAPTSAAHAAEAPAAVVVRAFMEANLDGKPKAAAACCLTPMAGTVAKAVPAGKGNRGAVTYAIRSATVKGAAATVVVRMRNRNIPEPFSEFLVTYAVKQTDDGWRIAEVADLTPHLEPLDFGEGDR